MATDGSYRHCVACNKMVPADQFVGDICVDCAAEYEREVMEFEFQLTVRKLTDMDIRVIA